MKPVSVRFRCFGPYMDEQCVDFSLLEKSGLFLICGETGSGKTTILDAMCYALYGKSSGGLRGDMAVMRCKQAGQSDETFVEFVFESGGQRYRFFRSLKPKNKRKSKSESEENADRKKKPVQSEFNVTCECQKLVDGEFVPLPDAKDKVTYLNEKAKEIIGLTYDQFRQVIILPQGQFEQLLVSNSEEKESILVTLFHAEKWQKLAIKLYELADGQSKALDQEKVSIQEQLRSYSCDTPAELMDCALAEAEKVLQLQQEVKSAEAVLKEHKKKHETALIDNVGFEQRDKLKLNLDGILKQSEKFSQEAVLLGLSDKADEIAPVYNEYKNLLEKKNECDNALVQANEALIRSEKALNAVMELQQKHEERREGYQKGKEYVIRLNDSRILYSTLEQKRKAAEAAAAELKSAEKQASQAADKYQRMNAAWETAIKQQKLAIEAHQTAQQQYLQGIGGILARDLVDGQECPVCGSRSHPSPACPAEEHITDQQLDEFAEAMKNANEGEAAARKNRKDAEENNTKEQQALSEKRQIEIACRSDFENSQKQRIDGIDNTQQLEKAIQLYSRTIADYEKEDSEMQENITAARSQYQAAQTGLQTAQTALKAALERFEEQRQRWEEIRISAGFETDQSYTEACMDSTEKQRRKEALIQFNTDKANAQMAYDEKQKELADKVQPDIESVKKQLDEAEKQRDEINGKIIITQQKQKKMQSDAEALGERCRVYEHKRAETEERLVFAKRLRGDFGVSLQRYVLGVMLTSITTAANRLLKTVYSGRYQLYRTNEAAGSSRKRGLELEVYDANNNERRSVTTLSGGEKFLVALSLAIGLSTVVQSQGTGVRIEAMFIDEGFGSLDSDSINDALEVLQGIRRSSGLVGIISHVDQLAETIPAKIQITKGRNGSRCEIIC